MVMTEAMIMPRPKRKLRKRRRFQPSRVRVRAAEVAERGFVAMSYALLNGLQIGDYITMGSDHRNGHIYQRVRPSFWPENGLKSTFLRAKTKREVILAAEAGWASCCGGGGGAGG